MKHLLFVMKSCLFCHLAAQCSYFLTSSISFFIYGHVWSKCAILTCSDIRSTTNVQYLKSDFFCVKPLYSFHCGRLFKDITTGLNLGICQYFFIHFKYVHQLSICFRNSFRRDILEQFLNCVMSCNRSMSV